MLLLAAASAAYGSQVVVTFVGVPDGTPRDNSGHFVTPYEVTITDENGTHMQLVTCYNEIDHVDLGDHFTANQLTLTEAAATGFFATHPDASIGLAGYQEVAWLSAQSYSDADHEIALQHAIWDVFGAAPVNESAQQAIYFAEYKQAVATAALNSYAGYESVLANARFLEQVGGVAGHINPLTGQPTEQPFVFGVLVPTTGNSFGGTPEPGTWMMLGGGLLCMASSFGFKKFVAKRG